MSTTKELLATLNGLRFANGKTDLTAWKQSRDKLDKAIATEQEIYDQKNVRSDETFLVDTDDTLLIGDDNDSSDLTSDVKSPVTETVASELEEKAPRGAIGALVIELLVTTMPYADIVAQVKYNYPTAKTTARSVASVAMDLRRDGIEVPSRRKPAAPKPAKTTTPSSES